MTQHATSIAKSQAADETRSDRAVRSHHWSVLLLAIGLLVVAFALRITDSGLVELPLLNIQMPALCTWQQLFGVDCPFCEPDGLGTADAWERWEHKQGDPRLQRWFGEERVADE